MVTARDRANAIRVLTADAVSSANSGHAGMPLGMADIAEVLWCRVLRHSPAYPHWFNRDRIILSNGHGSMLQYSSLYLRGYPCSLNDIKMFRQIGSNAAGHPELNVDLGIETTTGPLGQGFANAVGMALAEQILAHRFNQHDIKLIDHASYVLLGDGCLMEGISHEAASLAGTLGLGKLIAIWDDNGISIDGEIKDWCMDDVVTRFESYGWQVIHSIDGHDAIAIEKALDQARLEISRPTLVCCKTIIGYGSKFAKTAKAHGAFDSADEGSNIRRELDWQSHEEFEIPDAILRSWRDIKDDAYDKWRETLLEYKHKYPEHADELGRLINGQLPKDFVQNIYNNVKSINAPMATRQSSGAILDVLGKFLPELTGGSADLAGSNCVKWQGAISYLPDRPANYINYGVREFAMFAISSGLVLHGGLKVFCATFLVFSDYARNAIRLAAMMKIPVTYVLTHDSVAVGEDGPTHQPVEQIDSLRLIPSLHVWRPCDQLETTVAWVESLKNKSTTALLLSRQALPQLSFNNRESIAKGGYELYIPNSKKLDGIIIATGSEVSLALTCAQQLSTQNVFYKVVSMPCVEVFLQQPREWQDKVLPPEINNKIAIEAGIGISWLRFVPDVSCILAVDSFGFSGPGKKVMEHFGFTVENLIKLALRKAGGSNG